MKIIKAYPPNFSQLKKAFPFIVGRPGILYAWGDRIFNPSGVKVTPWILAHEEVHSKQQQQADPYIRYSIQDWWDKYLAYPIFRLEQEIEAHQAEYRAYPFQGNLTYLEQIAERLSSPLYGNLISKEDARRAIASDNVRPNEEDGLPL